MCQLPKRTVTLDIALDYIILLFCGIIIAMYLLSNEILKTQSLTNLMLILIFLMFNITAHYLRDILHVLINTKRKAAIPCLERSNSQTTFTVLE